ncbi:glutamine--fructose-6-phosphate transaminase (isomerizing) [Chloroflexota bacterium]
MCGIVGYVGNRTAQQILLSSLSRLEYRGYDSCGIAISGSGIKIYKDVLRVAELAKVAPLLNGTIGIGHTRWATCGEPSVTNAHPHIGCNSDVAVVHNGVITNHNSLRKQLIDEGHTFITETDTEVIPHLIEKYYEGNLEEAVSSAVEILEGSYAIAVLMVNEQKLVVARKDSPLIIGVGDQETFIASDVPAILDYTDRLIYLEDGDIGVLSGDNIKIFKNGEEVTREEHKILWTLEAAQRGGYEHFMLKEIFEQPTVIRDTLAEYARTPVSFGDLIKIRDGGFESIIILACGTSYNAALVGKYVIEDLVGVPVRVEIASEFNYYERTLSGSLTIVITQSGETADIIKAIRKITGTGGQVIAITNVADSSISRIADQTIYTKAGPEISVAATKSFSAQLMVLYWLAMGSSKVSASRLSALRMELRQLPSKAQQVLDNTEVIKQYAGYLSGYENAFFIGRGINFPIALEGALKLKEISYIHAEGYASGELKHGPFALLGENTPVIAIVSHDNTYDAMLTNIREIEARKSPLIALVEKEDETVAKLVDFVIPMPRIDPLFSPVTNVIALQLLSYYTAKIRGCSIDFPKNLAKSVTVE